MPEGTEKDAAAGAADLAPKAGCGACPSQSGSTAGCSKTAVAAVLVEKSCGLVEKTCGLAENEAALLSTGDLARNCETTVRTVRFYEEAGLIEPMARSEGGHRMFDPDQLARLQLIMDLREAGLSLQDIKALFELKAGSGSAEAASKQMSQALEAQIECMTRKIAVLRRLREELASMVATLSECENCEAPEFQSKCDTCDVMNRPEISRAMRLLWGSRS